MVSTELDTCAAVLLFSSAVETQDCVRKFCEGDAASKTPGLERSGAEGIVQYKTFNVEDVLHALHEQQRVALCLRKSFNGTKELNVDPAPLSGLEALAAAKNQTAAFRSTRPSQRSVITIGPGNGRSTREFELIWWPLYAQTSSGFLTLRFYIGKVIL